MKHRRPQANAVSSETSGMERSLPACGLALVLASCHTVEAVIGAPPEFWLHVEAIGIAMWNDLVSLVELVL